MSLEEPFLLKPPQQESDTFMSLYYYKSYNMYFIAKVFIIYFNIINTTIDYKLADGF